MTVRIGGAGRPAAGQQPGSRGPPDPKRLRVITGLWRYQPPASDSATALALASPAAQVGEGSERHPELDHLHGLVVFGSDGAGEPFAFTPDGTVVMISWIGNGDEAIPQGSFDS